MLAPDVVIGPTTSMMSTRTAHHRHLMEFVSIHHQLCKLAQQTCPADRPGAYRGVYEAAWVDNGVVQAALQSMRPFSICCLFVCLFGASL